MLVISSVKVLKEVLVNVNDPERYIEFEKEKVAMGVGAKICEVVPFCESEDDTTKTFEQHLQVFPEPMWQEFRQKLLSRYGVTKLELKSMIEDLDRSMKQIKESDESAS